MATIINLKGEKIFTEIKRLSDMQEIVGGKVDFFFNNENKEKCFVFCSDNKKFNEIASQMSGKDMFGDVILLENNEF